MQSNENKKFAQEKKKDQENDAPDIRIRADYGAFEWPNYHNYGFSYF